MTQSLKKEQNTAKNTTVPIAGMPLIYATNVEFSEMGADQLNKLCCQVNPFLVCGECLSLFCYICWQRDSTHIIKGQSCDECLHCPKTNKNIGTLSYLSHCNINKLREKTSRLMKEYHTEFVLVAEK